MPHVGRIPSTLEKYRHALSAYLEDVTQLNLKASNSFLYLREESEHKKDCEISKKSMTPIPDTQTRINASYNTVKKQLDLLSSYFSLIHDDLHGDLLLLRTNLNLLPSNTLHIASKNKNSSKKCLTNSYNSSLHSINNNTSSATSIIDADCQSISEQEDESDPDLNDNDDDVDIMDEDDDDIEEESKTNYDSNSGLSIHSVTHSASPPTSTATVSDVDEFNLDNILNTKQTQSIQYIVSILQKFVKYNAILIEYIHQNKSKIDSFWVQNDIPNHPQIHKLNLDVESIVSTMCVKDLIQTKNYSSHNILFHDILGCANTKQFFTRIYFIVSIWYSFFHTLHLSEYHDDDDSDKDHNQHSDDEETKHQKVKPCNSYLTKLFAMTDFSFLTKSSSSSSSSNTNNTSNTSTNPSTSASISTQQSLSDLSTENHSNSTHLHPNNRHRNRRNVRRRRRHRNHTNLRHHTNNPHPHNNHNHLLSTRSRQSSADSQYSWSSNSSNDGCDGELSLTSDSTNSKNDFLLKYLNAQNNYLQSIWHDGIALLEYSLHLLQQQEFRLSCRVAHRCLELFQKQQLEQQRIRHARQQQENWNHLNQDLYAQDPANNDHHNISPNTATSAAAHNHSPHGFGNGVFMMDPITNQPAQIPGLWYIEMHLANCYHTWGQSNMALYHINRTLDQLGNYQINPDTLTVRLNTRRRFKLLSSYLVCSAERALNITSKQQRRIMLSGNGGIRSSPRKNRGNVNEQNVMLIEDERKSPDEEILETKENDENGSCKKTTRRRSFMRKIKINNRRKRKGSNNVFSKLFDRFSGSKKKNRRRKQQEIRNIYNMDESKSSTNNPDSEYDEPLNEYTEQEIFGRVRSDSQSQHSRSNSYSQSNSNSNSGQSRLADVVEEEKIDPETLQLQLCLEEDLNLNNNPELKLSEDTDNEIEQEEDEELEVEFFHNDQDTDHDEMNDDIENNGTQMITLEALLSMHMTKGRILIEMKLLKEALDLYTYIIEECEALIKYHSLINPHHIQLEREYDQYEEEKQERLQMTAASSSSSSASSSSISIMSGTNNRRHRRRRNRRRSRDNDENEEVNFMHHAHGHHHHHRHHHHRQPPPNTPFRRLTKNIGLENYYAARGDIYFKFKDLKNALRDFSNAIKYGKCKKEMGIYYNLRGVCYHEMKQYDRALRDYDNAVKSMYGNHVAWNNRAALLVDMQQYDDAIENANNAIKLDPSYGNAYKHRGVAYHLKCEFEKAITDINRCIKLLPNYRPARLALLAIWKDIFECVRILNVDEGVPLDLIKIMVDYSVGNGYEIDEYMVNFTYC